MSNVYKQLPWALRMQTLLRKKEAAPLRKTNIQKEPSRLCEPIIAALGVKWGALASDCHEEEVSLDHTGSSGSVLPFV